MNFKLNKLVNTRVIETVSLKVQSNLLNVQMN